MPTQSSENGGMYWGTLAGYRLEVSPSERRERSNAAIAWRASRSSPVRA